jgi:hypothetical protein
VTDANDRPSAASRRLGAASLLAACGPPLAFCILLAAPTGAAGDLAFAAALCFAPAAGFALGIAGVCWKGRASRLAVAGLALNSLRGALLISAHLAGPPRHGWYKEQVATWPGHGPPRSTP